MNRVPNPLIDRLVDDLVPVRPLRLVHGLVLVALAALASVAAAEISLGLWRGALAGQASSIFFIANGMLGVVGAAAAVAVVRMASPRVGNNQEGARWSLGMLALLPATAMTSFALGGSLADVIGDSAGLECFVAGSVLGLITASVLTLWLRRGAPVSLRSAGLFTGVAAGAIGSFAYGLACPFDAIGHLGIWHVLPVVLSAWAGRLVIPWLIRW